MPDFCFTKHASEVVCVSIGANLLLPIASTILSNLLSGIKTDPTAIVQENFTNQKLFKFITDSDLKKIGKRAAKIDFLRESCKNKQGLWSLVFEFVAAFVGLFLLWSGWVDDENIAPYCGLLCLPPVFEVVPPFMRYLWLRFRLYLCVKCIVLTARFRGWMESRSQRKSESEDNIEKFVADARNEINSYRR